MGTRKVCESNELLPKATESPTKKRTASIESRYQSELKKLQRLTKDAIPDEKRSAVLPLMSNIAFLKVKLDEARRELMHESIFTEYDNGGGQSGVREHPGFSAYNKLFTTFSRGIKQLTDMMPSGSTAGDALIDYLNETRFGG